MWASDTATISLINGNVILVQNRTGRPLQGNLRLDIGPFGSDLRRASLREEILKLDHREICGEPDSKRLLFYVDGLLLKQRLLSIGYLQTHLILQLLAAHLSLPDLQFVAHSIRLGNTIPQRYRQLQTNSVGRKVASKDLSQRGAIAAEVQTSGRRAGLTSALPAPSSAAPSSSSAGAEDPLPGPLQVGAPASH